VTERDVHSFNIYLSTYRNSRSLIII